MSHTVFVPKKKRRGAPLAQTLATVPGLEFASPDGAAALETGEQVLVACTGAVRGVAITQKKGGTAVQIFTASSRADVDLAIQLVLVLMAAGVGEAINEDEEEFSSPEEVAERYDDAFREAYVNWGPGALAEMAMEADSSVLLTGPWTEVTLPASELRELRDRTGDDFAAAVLELVATRQAQARPLHLAFANPSPGMFDSDPLVLAQVVAAWIANQPSCADAASTWRLLSVLPDAVLAAEARLLRTALVVAAEAVPDRTAPGVARVHDLAVKLASKDVSFAGSLAGVAREFAEGGSFTRALALHDVVMALPPLDTDLVEVASWAPKAASKRKAQVPAQAMWVCNATWAAQADNNKQPVDPARARAYLTQAAQFAPLNPPIFINLACIAFELADHDAAIRLVSQAAEHGCDTRTLAAEPLLAPLHTHPRWANALAGQA